MNKSRLVSFVTHAALIALLFAGFRVTRPVVERQRFAEQLVFPVAAMALPVPRATPSSSQAPRGGAAAPITPTRLSIGAPSALRPARPVDEQPVPLVALSQPGTLELPSSTLRVAEAPQVTVGAFGGATPAGSASGIGQPAGLAPRPELDAAGRHAWSPRASTCPRRRRRRARSLRVSPGLPRSSLRL